MYVPWESMQMENVDLLRNLVETEGAIRGINLVLEETILEYDITSDGEKDAILITCEEAEEYILRILRYINFLKINYRKYAIFTVIT